MPTLEPDDQGVKVPSEPAQSAEIGAVEREAFIAEHTSALTDALVGIGIEDADWHDGSMLADALFCDGWRHKPWLSDRHLPPASTPEEGTR